MNAPNSLTKGYKQLIAEANAVIQTIPAGDAVDDIQQGDVVIVDLRELPELERDGIIPGAIHAPRGLLEFYADPESPYFKDAFSLEKRIMLYCATGGRSALAAQQLREMGLKDVAHVGGGFKAWKEAGGAVQPYNAA